MFKSGVQANFLSKLMTIFVSFLYNTKPWIKWMINCSEREDCFNKIKTGSNVTTKEDYLAYSVKIKHLDLKD